MRRACRRALPLLVAALLASACSGGSDGADDATPSTTSSVTSTTTTTTIAPTTPVATWPLVDRVPAFRNAGINVVAGLSYQPLLDERLRQQRALLTLDEARGAFAFVPERPDGPADRIELAGVTGDARVWPFVVTDADELRVFVDPGDPGDCTATVATEEPFAVFSITGTVDGALAVATATCVDHEIVDETVVGSFDGLAGAVRAFGVLVTADAGGTGEPVGIEWLALAADVDGAASEQLRVEVAGAEHLIAERSADPDDDATLDVLHVLRDDGSVFEVPIGADGAFVLTRSELGGPAKLWLEDYGREHYVAQGPWIDPAELTADLVIDATPTFEIADGPPGPSDAHRIPHHLQIWNGSRTKMERQEFRGANWNNDLGFPDRDRDPANPNGCTRIAWLGGSYVAAIQTRVDQKPGLIAEALLDVRGDGCHEVITLGQNLFSVEMHAENARSMVEDYGVTHLIFSVSANELCRMNDVDYSQANGVAPDTPIHWRWFDGDWVEPVPRREAEAVEFPDDFRRADHCSFDPAEPGFAGLDPLFAKLDEMGDAMEAWGDVEVTFLAMRDVLAGDVALATDVVDRCRATGHDCLALPLPEFGPKPDDLRAVDFNPFLMRYQGDGHPNERANQHIADGLLTAVLDVADRASTDG